MGSDSNIGVAKNIVRKRRKTVSQLIKEEVEGEGLQQITFLPTNPKDCFDKLQLTLQKKKAEKNWRRSSCSSM